MRKALALLLLACTTLPAPALADPGPADVPDLRIVEILPAPDAALGQREFVELLNAGAADVDLAGWRLRDAPTASNATNEFTFPALVLPAGRRVVVWSNGSADALGPAWSSSASKAVWNDAGDAATLLDPEGQVRGWAGYGSTSQAPPSGFAAAPKPAAPGKGRSVALADGAWTAGEPTPGLAPGQQGGAVSAHVVNVPPLATLRGPAGAGPGEAVGLRLNVSDGNGDAGLAWTLSSQGQALRQGNGSFDGLVAATAPRQGPWALTLAARDAGGLWANATWTVAILLPRLAVAMPPGGSLRFPDLRPGDRDVTSLDALTLRNDGDAPAQPLADVSALRAGTATIPVEGNLWLGVTVEGEPTAWLRYDAPLQPLPPLAPGASATLALRIAAVPEPAAAGLYGTTFTLVAA